MQYKTFTSSSVRSLVNLIDYIYRGDCRAQICICFTFRGRVCAGLSTWLALILQQNQEVQSVFTSQTSPSLPRSALFQGTTLAVIKPHVFNAPSPVTGKRETGKILDEILHSGRFTITDMEIFHLETVNAEEFLEVYKDVVPEYQVCSRFRSLIRARTGHA